MIGCTVTSLSISGMRLVWIMLRFTMIQDCWAMLVGWVAVAALAAGMRARSSCDGRHASISSSSVR